MNFLLPQIDFNDQKSIIKMFTLKKKSTLTSKDLVSHMCI